MARVSIRVEVIPVTMIVVPKQYLQAPVLLGMDIIGQLQLEINYEHQTVNISGTVYDLRQEEHVMAKIESVRKVEEREREREESKECQYLRLGITVRIELFSCEFIELEITEGNNNLIVAYPHHRMIQPGLALLLKIVGGKVYLPIINNTKEKSKLRAGTLLTKSEWVEEQDIEVEDTNRLVNKISEAMGPENDNVTGQLSRAQKLNRLLEKQDWSHLDEKQKSEMFEIVLCHANLFVVDKKELRLIKQKPAHIQIKDPNPCRSAVYRYPEKAKETIRQILKDLEDRDIIERSTAAWLSPFVLVNKPNGEKRMRLDYREVNTHLVTDIHPLLH